MSRCLQVSTIVVSFLAMICIIVSLATNCWMTACMDTTSMMQSAGGAAELPPSITKMMNGDICFTTGLFQISFSFMQLHSAVGLPVNSMDSFVKVTIGLLAFSLLVLLFGAVLVGLSVCSVSMSSRRKVLARLYNGIGAIALFIAAIFILAGALAYTVPQSQLVHQPLPWMAQLGKTFTKIMPGSLFPAGGSIPSMGSDGSSFPGFNTDGTGSYDPSTLSGFGGNGTNNFDPSSLPGFGGDGTNNFDPLSLPGLGGNGTNNFDPSSLPGFNAGTNGDNPSSLPGPNNDGTNNFDPSSLPSFVGGGTNGFDPSSLPDLGSNVPHEDSSSVLSESVSPNENSRGSSIVPGFGVLDGNATSSMTQSLMQTFGHMDPVFGYSMYFSYVAFIFTVLAAIMAAVVSCRGSVEYPDTVPLDSNIGRI
uniref:uncharacterized protein LOC100185420 isoform X2 n=1 Tax=Ciona intestinalis TaxID=7719 RepID=UPI000180C59B|nr:uncharacterized protein LOC100185420 isoform X2 [Ciona intestinalis]|eukprot:XP_002131840.1 uncharacterized protein LOC100185420 isoform X2 [Ciona intestinalis]